VNIVEKGLEMEGIDAISCFPSCWSTKRSRSYEVKEGTTQPTKNEKSSPELRVKAFDSS
jgi:hypothetical protein